MFIPGEMSLGELQDWADVHAGWIRQSYELLEEGKGDLEVTMQLAKDLSVLHRLHALRSAQEWGNKRLEREQ